MRTPKLYRHLASTVLVIGNSWKPAQELQSPSSPNLLTNESRGAAELTNGRRGRGAWFQEFFWLTRGLASFGTEANTADEEVAIALVLTFNLSYSYHSYHCCAHSEDWFKHQQPTSSNNSDLLIYKYIQFALLFNTKWMASIVCPNLVSFAAKSRESCFKIPEKNEDAAVFPDPADRQDWSCLSATPRPSLLCLPTAPPLLYGRAVCFTLIVHRPFTAFRMLYLTLW